MTAIEQGQEPPAPKYKRVLMKISGEALMGERAYGLDPDMVSQVANEIRSVWDLGGEVCVVIGGGHRQPLFHDRYRCRAAGLRNGLRRDAEGDKGRRCL